MSELSDVWKRLSTSEKRRAGIAGVLIVWGLALTADMYYLKQRPDVQQLFDLAPEGAEEESQQEQQPWKQKDSAQVDAEINERAAQLAAAAGRPWSPRQQSEAQQPEKSWWSIRFKS